jgi:hypothetical protein
MYCVAACVRDAQGCCFVKAYTQSFEGNPEIAKALGVLEALRWDKTWTIDSVQIETDCLQVVPVIHSKFRNNTEFGIVI